MSKRNNRAAQRAARKRVETAMAEIAQRSFSRAFDEMFEVSAREDSPRYVGDFTRWFLRAMKNRLESYPPAS